MDRVNVPHVGVGSTAHDFVKLAEGFGCAGVRVDSLAAMQDAFRAAATADGPTLIEVSPGLALAAVGREVLVVLVAGEVAAPAPALRAERAHRLVAAQDHRAMAPR